MDKKARDGRRGGWRGGLEPLEPRQMLAATVLNFGAAVPEFLNDAPSTVEIEFSEAVLGFDTSHLLLTVNDGTGVRQIESLSGLSLTTSDGGTHWQLENLATLTAAEGEYQLTLDVLGSGLPLDPAGFGLGPELITNGTFDTAGGGSNNLTGWSVPFGGVVWQQENPGDGVARIISDASHPDGAAGARTHQRVTLQANTAYQLEFDFVTTDVGSGTSVWLRVIDHRGSGPGRLLTPNLDEDDNGHLTYDLLTLDDTDIFIGFSAPTSPFPQVRNFTIDNVSLRQIVLGPTVQWTMNTTAPTATISEVDRDPRNESVEEFTITFSEPVTGLDAGDFSLTRDGFGVSLSGAQWTTADGITWTLSGFAAATSPDGNYVLTLNTAATDIQDLATNLIGQGDSESWLMETVAPVIGIDPQISDEVSPRLTGSVDDPLAGVSIRLVGHNFPAADFSAINNGNGTWTLPAGVISPALAVDGTYDVQATATDRAGNSGVDTTSGELTLDRVPVVTVDPLVTQDTTPPLSGTVDDPTATVVVRVDGVTYPAIVTPPATNNSLAIWRLPDNTISPPLAETLFDVQATATDSGGKVGVDGTLRELTVGPAVIISEFMADNNNTLVDFEGDSSDWIELLNIGSALDPAVGLQGWFLTDEPNNLTKWEVPLVTPLGTNQQVLIYASGKDLVSPAGEMHTNFQIGSGGEYLALVKPDGVTIAAEFTNPPNQREDISYGRVGFEARWFPTPTPNAPNNAGVIGFTDVAIDQESGLFDQPIVVTISTASTPATPDAVIRYTTDGSEPTSDNGTDYTGPLTIDGTTILRVAAILEDHEPTKIETRSYIFLDDVLEQDGAGLPTTWGKYQGGNQAGQNVPADYAVDTRVVNDPRYRDTIRDDLRSIPTISLVMDMDELFNSQTGIYSNPTLHGIAWERPASAELIGTDGNVAFRVDAGLRIHGGFSRFPRASNKHSFRLLFKTIYGPGKLDYPLFGDDATDKFDTIILRAGFSDAWGPGGNADSTYLQDRWTAQSQLDAGGVAGHGIYVHLYVNGLYWGLYNPVERPNASFAASYLGGEEEDYDAYVTGKNIDGDSVAWNQLLNTVRQGNIDYTAVQEMLDVPAFIDYLVINQFGGNWDWPHSNWYATGGREPGGKWLFHSWDGEGNLSDNGNRINNFGNNGPGEIYQRLRNVPEFRREFQDAVHRHLFNGGLLTPQANIDRVTAIASQFERAIVGESARWGDRPRSTGTPRTLDDTWRPRMNWLTGTYFPQRTNIVINQYRSAELYPRTAAPSFNQHGGAIDVSGFDLEITNVAGTGEVYFTLDGSDPQSADGSISPTALRYDGTPVVLLQNTVVKARALDSVGWSALNEASFVMPRPLTLAVTEIMYNPGATTSDEEAAGVTDRGALEFIELQNTGNEAIDLAGVRLSDAVSFDFAGGLLAPGERVLVVGQGDEGAFNARYPHVAAETIAGQFSGKLKGQERVVLTDAFGRTVLDFEYKDRWYGITDGEGFSLSILDAQAHPSTWAKKSSWQPSSEIGGSPGQDDPRTVPAPDSIVINEVLTHTDTATGDWIELLNTTAQPIDIGGWYLSDSGSNRRKFRIPEGTVIPAGSFVTFNQFGLGGPAGFGDDPANNPGAFGLSELGDSLRLSSVDPDLIRENVDAAHVMPDRSIVLSTRGNAMLGANALAFGNGDLIRYDPLTDEATLFLAESRFAGGREDVDAVSILANGNIVLSTDGPARLGGLDFGNGDLIEYNPTTNVATLLFSEALFTGGNENIDAVHVRADGSLIVSTAGPAKILGTDTLFDDGDLIEIIPGTDADLADAQLGTGAIVRRYLAESVFAVGAVAGDSTENIDAVSLVPTDGQDAVVLSTTSGAAFKELGAAFQNGDLVQLSGGGNDLGGGTIGGGAQLQLLLEEQPAGGRTFYGDVGGYREKAAFGAAESEVTFGRYIKSTGGEDFVAMSARTPGGANAAPKVGPVVINELMYHPPGDLTPTDTTDDVEFIELLNISGSAFSMFDTASPNNTWRLTEGVTFAFPAGVILEAGEHVLVLPKPTSQFADFAAFEADFRANHNLPDNLPDSVRIFGPYGGALNNGGEDVELSRPGKPELDGTIPLILVDRVNYDNAAPWPTEPDGSGPSLSRFDSTGYGNDVANWLPSAGPGGTPGAANATIDVSPPSVPADLSVAVITTERVDLSWTASVDPHTGVAAYRVYRNDVLLGETPALGFSDTTAAPGTYYSYEVTAVNSVGLASARSLPADIAIFAVQSADVPVNTEVIVVFSERVDEALAEQIDNYVLVGPTTVTILAANREIDGRTVRLTTSLLQDEATYQLTVSDVVALSGSRLPLTPSTFDVVVPDVTPPTIVEVLVGSSGWSQNFLDLVVAARGLGDGAISMPAGAAQLTPLSWSGLDVVSIRFSERVTVRQRDLTITGVNRAVYDFADFQYDDVLHVATWTLSAPIGTDKLLLDLSDAVHDGEGNPIDGNWPSSTGAFPSGNGVLQSNDNFRFRIDVAIADGNGDGVLSRGDLIDVIHSLGVRLTASHYDPRLDVNADGQIDVVDLRLTLRRLSSRLPSAEPQIATAQPALVAIDAVFTRQGAGASPALKAEPLPARHPDISDVTTSDPSGRASIKDRLKARSLLRALRTVSRRVRALAPQLDGASVDRAIEAEHIALSRRSHALRRR